MSSDRMRRFLHLERPRPPGAESEPPVSEERFEKVEPAGPEPAPEPVPGAATDRFRPPRERPLDVADAPEGVQPFVRCARCEMDSARFAEICPNCGADLRTPEQAAFNERLWDGRRQEAAAEEQVLAERRRERERLATEEQRARREQLAGMARREADRVEGELGSPWGRRHGWGTDADDGRAPAGLRLLRLIQNPLLRIAAIAGAVALPLGLLVLPSRQSGWRIAGMVLLFLLVALVSPPGWRYRRRDRWRW